MKKHVLFIHGAGEGAYKEDGLLARNLQKELGSEYKVHYPLMPDEENAPYDLWKQKIVQQIIDIRAPLFLVGHSVGASYIPKFLAENNSTNFVDGVFLLSAPFWGGNGWLYEGYQELELPKNIASIIPKDINVFLYHAHDDEIVPFKHLTLYAELFPHAFVREIDKGGHQLHNHLTQVVEDIKWLNEK